MLSGRTVGAISGGTSALLLSAMNPNINYSISVKLMRSFDEGFDLLEQGHISAFVTDDIIIHSKLAEMADRDDYQMSAEGFGDVIPYGMVIAKDADEIESIINDELKNLFISNDLMSYIINGSCPRFLLLVKICGNPCQMISSKKKIAIYLHPKLQLQTKNEQQNIKRTPARVFAQRSHDE